MTATVIGVRRTLGDMAATVFGMAALAVQAAMIVVLAGLIMWTVGGWVHDQMWPPHHDTRTVEVCWVARGPNGLEKVRGPRADEPEPGSAVEVACS